MSFLHKFSELCGRTDLDDSDKEEEERYSFPPRLTQYVTWWTNWKIWNLNRNDGIDENNPYD